MKSTQQQIVEATFTDSNAGRIHFGEVVSRLMEAGVESYAVDYRSHLTTYRLQNDETLTLEMYPSGHAITDIFSAAGVQAAVKGAQQGTVLYPEFKRLSMQAGCIGYTVWITGRHVSYYGRRGEIHAEHFPN